MIKKLNYIFAKRDRVIIVILMGLVIVGSYLELLGVTIFMPFTEVIMNPSAIQDTEILNNFYQWFAFDSTGQFLNAMCVAIIAIYIVKNLFIWIQQYLILKFSYSMQRKLSIRLLTTYMKEPYTFHLNKNVAELQRSMQEDTALFTQALMHTLQLIAEVAVCVTLGIGLYSISNSITVVVGLLLIACVGLFTYVTRRFSKRLGQESQVYKAKLYQWVNQSLGGIKEVKVLNRESFFVASYQKYYRLYVKGARVNRLISISPKYLVEAVCMTGLLVAVMIKLNFGQSSLETFIPQLAAFAVASFKLLPAVGRINEHVNNINYALPSVELIYHDLKEIEDYVETEQKNKESGTAWEFENAITVRHISYSYPNSDKIILDDVECVIPKGKTVAFIGSSGAGKTTIADIILGLLTPQLGKVKADNMDVFKNLDLWHHQIGYIPQVIYLSDDTVRNNVAFGIMEQDIDNEAVTEALRKAQMWDFIETLPEGLDTLVGDRGVRLSGGQRQRIGIARALYHDPEILVLDEATSALDSETETAVMESVESLKGIKTMMIIAHRLTTIRKADIIYEVIDGKVLERSREEIFDNQMEGAR